MIFIDVSLIRWSATVSVANRGKRSACAQVNKKGGPQPASFVSGFKLRPFAGPTLRWSSDLLGLHVLLILQLFQHRFRVGLKLVTFRGLVDEHLQVIRCLLVERLGFFLLSFSFLGGPGI